ncbi:MAG: ATP synthase subunit C [Candidatus Eremiobacteraeota bacterium]|nr:ATP synthase subunit C [Candidatus Eremiobacteraeota bacterium]
MDLLYVTLGWIGIYAPVALGSMGSIIGCARAGQAAIGALLDVESGYGKYIGLSAMPSTHSIFGIVIMLSLNMKVDAVHGPGLFAVGVLSGLGLLICGMCQGQACASSIQASKSKPEIFGISIAPAGIIEGFAVFILVFALVLSGSIKG